MNRIHHYWHISENVTHSFKKKKKKETNNYYIIYYVFLTKIDYKFEILIKNKKYKNVFKQL